MELSTTTAPTTATESTTSSGPATTPRTQSSVPLETTVGTSSSTTTTLSAEITGAVQTTLTVVTTTVSGTTTEPITIKASATSTAQISSTGSTSATTSLLPETTSTLPPTTSAMKYCEETNGMNQPVDIQPGQVSSNPSPSNPSPSGDINPTTTKPGLNFPSDKPQINFTLTQSQEINIIYVPNNRPGKPTTVEEFTVQFLFPNGTLSPVFTSVIPSTSGTTTPSTGAGSESTTTPSTVNGIVPPSDSSPQVQLSENYDVPKDTIIIFTVKKTKDNSPATGVCIDCRMNYRKNSG